MNRMTERILFGTGAAGVGALAASTGYTYGIGEGRLSSVAKIRKMNEAENERIAKEAFKKGLRDRIKTASDNIASSSSSSTTTPGRVVTTNPVSNRDGGSVSNTLPKSMKNADIQPISRSDNKVPNITQPAFEVSGDRSATSSKMSSMEDRRILDRPRASVGAMSL